MERSLRAVEAAFTEAAIDPSRWNAAMEIASKATGAFGAALFPIKGRLPDVPRSPSLAAAFETYLQDGWIHRDERYRAWPAAARSGVATDFDFTTEARIARDPYYQEFLAPHGLRWYAAVKVASGEDSWILSLQRTIAQGPFSAAEQRRLGCLSKRLSGVAALARALGFARAEAALDAFAASGSAVVMFDRLGEVLLVNEPAERLLGTDLQIQRKRLVCSANHDVTIALDRVLHSLTWQDGSAACAPPLVLPRRQGRPVLAYPMRLASVSMDALAPCRALVILIDLNAQEPSSQAVLQACFGLSPAEARLAVRLTCGHDLDAVSHQLGIGKETARSQIKSIFAKTDTQRQAELVALLAKLPRQG